MKNIQVNFSGDINEENVRAFISELKNKIEKNHESESLTVLISSSGGSIDIAIELFYFLKHLDCKITTVNTSIVNSAAIIIFAAGEKRIGLSYSSFYVHSVSKELNGIFTVEDLRREAREMEIHTEKIVEILANASAKNKAYWKKLMKKGCFLTAQKAKEIELVTEIS